MFKTEKLSHIVAVALLLIAVEIIVFANYFGIPRRTELSPERPQACTQEAMQCPDGSYVGRTGPNCEFAKCPSASRQLTGDECVSVGGKIVNTLGFEEWNQEDYIADVKGMRCPCICVKENNVIDISAWNTYRNEEYGFEVKYPEHWSVVNEKGSFSLFEGDVKMTSFSIVDLSVMGVTHCGAYPDDSGCEFFNGWIIDWRDSNTVNALIDYQGGAKGMMATLHKVTPALKEYFKRILSTFKFIPLVEKTEVLETGSGTYCESDDDCWCREFDGAQFGNGKVDSMCDLEANRCQRCYY